MNKETIQRLIKLAQEGCLSVEVGTPDNLYIEKGYSFHIKKLLINIFF